ncbi:MAG TPA: TrmH family RNA methyltransferase [Thermoanaerobaculia bacterium]|nr:TrmH family RNA methyltransferase [Thermoanaerobaculia bacterium]
MAASDLAVVLVRPYTPANLGSVARACRNFGVSDLRLVEPAAPVDEESHRLAAGADSTLAGLRRYAAYGEAVAEFDAVVATSSLRGREAQRFLALAELPAFLDGLGGAARVAFVFGPERSGLTEEERAQASACLRLPSRADFPTLNVSHAVAVVLAMARLTEEPLLDAAEPWAAASEVEAAVAHWDRALEAIGFYDTGHRDRSLRAWRRIVAARPLDRKEVAILRGVANRVLVSLRRSRQPSALSSQPDSEADS